jgi:hypothetical protein
VLSRHAHNPICGSDCRYRGLYEGAQASLSDMAGKQAVALSRTGRLRTGIVAGLKRNFPRVFGDVERQIGRRMSDLEDEILLAYLGHFLDQANGPAAAQPAAGTDELRAALTSAGFAVPDGDDLTGWAHAVRAASESAVLNDLEKLFAGQHSPAVTAAPAPGSPARPRRLVPPAQPAPRQDAAPGTASTIPAVPAEPAANPRRPRRGRRVPAEGAANPFAQNPATGAPVTAARPDETDGLTGLFATSANTAPTAAADEPEPFRNPFDDEPVTAAEPATTAAAEPAFGRRMTPPAPPAAAGDQPAPVPTDPTPGPATADPDPVAGAEVPAPSRTNRRRPAKNRTPDSAAADLPAAGPQVTTTPAPAAEQTAAAATVTERPADPVPAPAAAVPAQPVPAPAERQPGRLPVTPEQTATAPGRRPAGNSVMGLPLRPEMLAPSPPPKTSRRRATAGTKTPRATATPPALPVSDVPEPATGAPAVLTDNVRNLLMARITTTVPAFMSDLVAAADNDAAVVAAWENEQKGADDSAVRLIPPKTRHRHRGSLVLPTDYHRQAVTEFTASAWGMCMQRYRGAKLYELAVLIHRFNQQIVGQHLSDDTVMLRLNDRTRGMIGLIVVLESHLDEGGTTRQALVADMNGLLTEQVKMIAVLPTNAEVFEQTIETVEHEARLNGWRPPCPVIAARSWEYAQDLGTSAVEILAA